MPIEMERSFSSNKIDIAAWRYQSVFAEGNC